MTAKAGGLFSESWKPRTRSVRNPSYARTQMSPISFARRELAVGHGLRNENSMKNTMAAKDAAMAPRTSIRFLLRDLFRPAAISATSTSAVSAWDTTDLLFWTRATRGRRALRPLLQSGLIRLPSPGTSVHRTCTDLQPVGNPGATRRKRWSARTARLVAPSQRNPQPTLCAQSGAFDR